MAENENVTIKPEEKKEKAPVVKADKAPAVKIDKAPAVKIDKTPAVKPEKLPKADKPEKLPKADKPERLPRPAREKASSVKMDKKTLDSMGSKTAPATDINALKAANKAGKAPGEKSVSAGLIIGIVAAVLAIALLIVGFFYLKSIGIFGGKDDASQATEQTEETAEQPVSDNATAVADYPAPDQYTISYEEAVSLYNVPTTSDTVSNLAATVNPEIYAMVALPGCGIEEPVLQSATDELFYSSHDKTGAEAVDGCVYSQVFNEKDFNDNLTAIYGRNTEDGRLFTNLHYYEDPQFLAENPYIYIYTENQVLIYRISGAFTYPALHLLVVYETNTDEGYAKFINEINNMKLELNDNLVAEVVPTVNNKMISLSTGVSGNMDIRYLVQGILIAKANLPR